MNKKNDLFEIIQRADGRYWILWNGGGLNGPYDNIPQAEADLPELVDLQYPLGLSS